MLNSTDDDPSKIEICEVSRFFSGEDLPRQVLLSTKDLVLVGLMLATLVIVDVLHYVYPSELLSTHVVLTILELLPVLIIVFVLYRNIRTVHLKLKSEPFFKS